MYSFRFLPNEVTYRTFSYASVIRSCGDQLISELYDDVSAVVDEGPRGEMLIWQKLNDLLQRVDSGFYKSLDGISHGEKTLSGEGLLDLELLVPHDKCVWDISAMNRLFQADPDIYKSIAGIPQAEKMFIGRTRAEAEGKFQQHIDNSFTCDKANGDIIRGHPYVDWAGAAVLAIGDALIIYSAFPDREVMNLIKAMLDTAKLIKQLKSIGADYHTEIFKEMCDAVYWIVTASILCCRLLPCSVLPRKHDVFVNVREEIDRKKRDIVLKMQFMTLTIMTQPEDGSETLDFVEGIKIMLLATALYSARPPIQFTMKEMHEATDGFKNIIGRGASAIIYKGALPNGRQVAIKKLFAENGKMNFFLELEFLQFLSHRNIIKLKGCCVGGPEPMMVVYDYMPHCLADYISPRTIDNDKPLLEWGMRKNILVGIIRGLTYLQECTGICIVHRDIKPENIFLDANFNVKISDFGVAKAFPCTKNTTGLHNVKVEDFAREEQNVSYVAGTIGYIAPEYFVGGPVTAKGDIYSFGILALEVISGTRGFRLTGDDMEFIPGLASRLHREGRLVDLIDSGLINNAEFDSKCILRTIMIALWCIQADPDVRPPASQVLAMLSTDYEIPTPPAETKLPVFQKKNCLG